MEGDASYETKRKRIALMKLTKRKNAITETKNITNSELKFNEQI